jgi:hypothetical protein
MKIRYAIIATTGMYLTEFEFMHAHYTDDINEAILFKRWDVPKFIAYTLDNELIQILVDKSKNRERR